MFVELDRQSVTEPLACKAARRCQLTLQVDLTQYVYITFVQVPGLPDWPVRPIAQAIVHVC